MQSCGMPTMALAIRTMSSVSAARRAEVSIALEFPQGQVQGAADHVQAELGHGSLPQLDHADLADDPRRR